MKKILVLAVFLLLALAQSVSADTTIFQNGNCTSGVECGTIAGYTGTQDTFITNNNYYGGSTGVWPAERTTLYMSYDDPATPHHGYQEFFYADGGSTINYVDPDPNRIITHKDSYHDMDTSVLVQFDLGAYIPENMRIVSAELKMYKAYNTADPIVSVYQITEGPWTEEGKVSWEYRVAGNTTTAWNGAQKAILINKIDVANAGWYGWDVTSAVEDWYNEIDPNYGFVLRQETTNYGWADTSYKLIWTDTNGNGLREITELVNNGRDGDPEWVNLTQIWYSSEYGNECLRPKLIVTYEPVPEPATILLVGLGLIGLAGMRKRFKK